MQCTHTHTLMVLSRCPLTIFSSSYWRQQTPYLSFSLWLSIRVSVWCPLFQFNCKFCWHVSCFMLLSTMLPPLLPIFLRIYTLHFPLHPLHAQPFPSTILFHPPSLSPTVPPPLLLALPLLPTLPSLPHFTLSLHPPTSSLPPSISYNPQPPHFHTTIEIKACTKSSHQYPWWCWGRAVCRTRVTPLLRE